MQTLTVNLDRRSYPIHIGDGVLSMTGKFLRDARIQGKIAIVTNPTVAQLYLDSVHESLQQCGFAATPIVIPEGEEHKTLMTLSKILDALVSHRFERQDSVLALGGGVVGDLAGFAAAIYLRGIALVQIPTTLLAQVDSSVGGKTGVNHGDGKNLIGAFYQPRLVAIDVGVLASLPRRELVAGLAEVIKYGIIEDGEFFDVLEQKLGSLLTLNRQLMTQVISRCCAIKARVVEKDERENDYRAVLNFGHTVGHALEAATKYERFLHGEAVAIGMANAAKISAQRGFCDSTAARRVITLISKAGLPIAVPAEVSAQSLIDSMEVDKKSAGGKIRYVMCAGIGRARFHPLTAEEIAAAVCARTQPV
jgi:3-dehydroquinate synthase